jgi:hypothetical protein
MHRTRHEYSELTKSVISGWVATFAVWLNMLVIFITMGVMAHSPPNYAVSTLGSAGSKCESDVTKWVSLSVLGIPLTTLSSRGTVTDPMGTG